MQRREVFGGAVKGAAAESGYVVWHEVEAGRKRKVVRVKGDFLLSTLSFYPSGNLVVIYCGLVSPGGMGGEIGS